MSVSWKQRANCIDMWINHKRERKKHHSSKIANLHWVSWQNLPRPWAQHYEVGSSLSPEGHGFPQVAAEKKDFRETYHKLFLTFYLENFKPYHFERKSKTHQLQRVSSVTEIQPSGSDVNATWLGFRQRHPLEFIKCLNIIFISIFSGHIFVCILAWD